MIEKVSVINYNHIDRDHQINGFSFEMSNEGGSDEYMLDLGMIKSQE